jgi:molybdopterin synthase catalytic subunit
LIRDYSHDKPVLSVEYKDAEGTAESRLRQIASEIRQKWQVNNIAICHRIGKLKVGEINFFVAIAAAHRHEGFAACQYAVDRFKEIMPTQKKETYTDGSTWVE